MISIVLSLMYMVLMIFGLLNAWPYRRASPVFWLQFSLALMATGTFTMISWSDPVHRTYVYLMFIAHITFIASSIFFQRYYRTRYFFLTKDKKPQTDLGNDQIKMIFFIFVLSTIISFVYFYLVGYNVLLLLLQGSSDLDYSTLRLDAYSGDRYLAPGYVNQFKNVLLPLCALIIGIALKRKASLGLLVTYSAIAIPIVLLCLGGTGQRAFIVYTLVAIIFGYALDNESSSTGTSKIKIILFSAPIILVYVFMTAFYQAANVTESVFSTSLDRFTKIQQEGALFGFEYISALPISWFSEWGRDFIGIIPGVKGSTLAHDIHGALYGSTRGTIPLSSVGSAYHNGGIIGVVLLFTIMGWLYVYLYTRFLKGERNYARSYTYGFIFFYLAIYVADPPTVLLNNGVLVLIAFLYILRRGRTNRQYS